MTKIKNFIKNNIAEIGFVIGLAMAIIPLLIWVFNSSVAGGFICLGSIICLISCACGKL